jgi:carbon-monoxide dehydrogenase large subunit
MTAAIFRAARQGAGARRLGLQGAQAREPQARQAARPRHRHYLEVTAPPATNGRHPLRGRRHVTIITGTLDYGQGHASPFAQVLSTSSACRSTRSGCCRATATGADRRRRHRRLALDHASGTAIVEASAR